MNNQPLNRQYPNPSATWRVPGGHPGNYAGWYTDRRLKQDLRANRRWGDWSILGMSTPLLWLEADALLDETLLVDQAIDDLWP